MVYKHGKHEIELFDSIHNLPILRFQRFNKYQMQSVEIGSTFADYDDRTSKILQFLQKKMVKEAIEEMENRRQTVFNAFNDFSPSGKTLAILVKRIDKKEYNTFAPDDLDRCLKHLERIGLGTTDAMDHMKEVKKKMETELVVYFPNFFPKNGNLDQTSMRYKRMNLLLDGIIEKRDVADQLFKIEKDILMNDTPNVWNIWKEENVERSLEVDFQKFGIAVTGHTGQQLADISTFTFYATVEHLKEKFKK